MRFIGLAKALFACFLYYFFLRLDVREMYSFEELFDSLLYTSFE